ncbi:DNA (cytosine-5-)-methyltransferase [Listeria monocytogenes]|uniref:DNA (cytosine-5-)-methyltransferase n=2 Tax=Listeria TaxID=1637 RepID=UPI000854D0AB|nr:DNA (cytosine-5-)-methyltransferase [Listeria monocytogenes]ARJ88160.1 DNA (cytosine-5-)-methyltransferase [Listeria monocytogenes]EAC3819425.1 DNA (cytosine-5-)-methyltransferase [Listeria monocytogenes]EAC4662698.1 DNA (cytosine-5-)-methyltransferase [Listeria monocytogenes]EAC5508042.1 DNA (cytosine-5-)-methyltransferase [Listeria monocytogenes]EAC6224166.1 DNA (cytosine-5-)-methyltransferase [Listeria monocytogenes]
MSLNIFSMFDGVGGFIVGLNDANEAIEKEIFRTMYSNQFEPSKKAQDAYEVGVYRFPEMNHIPDDIMTVSDNKFQEMHDAGVNMIVGGFPCQDYSVARSLKDEQGIAGKKGVLFWEIIRAIKKIQPKYLILENVDRLLKSPSTQRGRDFAIMLGAFNKLGYSVEWRVINAAEYGRAQRRRRVFFFVYRNDTKWAKKIDEKYENDKLEEGLLEDVVIASNRYDDYIFQEGLFARQFPIENKIKYDGKRPRHASHFLGKDADYDDYILNISDNFTGTVWNTGIMRHGRYFTADTTPIEEPPISLGTIVEKAKQSFISQYDNLDLGIKKYNSYIEQYVISDEIKIEKFKTLRGSKKIPRKRPDGSEYFYAEGAMSPYDSFDLPARTMLTSEASVNRSTHLLFENNKYRLITPIEAELLQDFPIDWTKYKMNEETNEVSEVSDRMRYFFMGNALVTGIVKRIGIELAKIEGQE